jgi:hypothetical protein
LVLDFFKSWREWDIGTPAFWVQSVVFFGLSYFLFFKSQAWALGIMLFLLWFQVYLKKSW